MRIGLKIAGRKNPQANIFKLGHDGLQDHKNGKWLLVLDKVDSAGFLFETPPSNQASPPSSDQERHSVPLIAYLPRSPNGSILITTRSNGVALKMVEERNIIMVDAMDQDQALALLTKNLYTQTAGQEFVERAAVLEYMPLAIVQAAAYISQRAPRCSLRQYLDKFKRSDREKTTLLDYAGGHLRRDWEAENAILTTWQISFNHIRETRPSAADLLSLMSFFDRQGIPEALLRHQSIIDSASKDMESANEYFNMDGNNDDDDDDDDDKEEILKPGENEEFEEDTVMLGNYSFIAFNMDLTTFEMHGLVQLAMRKWLDAHGSLRDGSSNTLRIFVQSSQRQEGT